MAFKGRNDQQFNDFFGSGTRAIPEREEPRAGDDVFSAPRPSLGQPARKTPASAAPAAYAEPPRRSGRSEAVRRRFEPGHYGSHLSQPEERVHNHGQNSVDRNCAAPLIRQQNTNRPVSAAPYNSVPQQNTTPPSGRSEGKISPEDYGFEPPRKRDGVGKKVALGLFISLLTILITAAVVFAMRPADGGEYFLRNGSLPKVTNVHQTHAFRHGALLDWEPVDNVAGYKIYRADGMTGQFVHIKTAYLSFAFLGDLEQGSGGRYIVRPFCRSGSGEYVEQEADEITVKTMPGKAGTPEHKTATAHTITLEWMPAAGADGYEIERHTGSWNQYELCCDTDQAQGEIPGLEASTEYKFRMRPYIQLEGKRCYGSWSEKYVSGTSPEMVKELSQGETTDSGYMLSWTISSAATGYEVYRADAESGETTELLGQCGNTGYEISGLESVNISSYRVRAFMRHSGGVSYGEFSDVLTAVTLPTKVKGMDQYTAVSGDYTISWEPSERTEGYELYAYRFTSGDYELMATVADSSYTITGLTECAERYKVRPFVSLGDLKFFGEFSDEMASHPYVNLTRKVKVDRDTTALRTGAGPEFELIKDIKRGTSGRVFGEKSGSDGARWFRVELNDGSTGWLSRDDVSITNSFKTLETREYTEQQPIVIYLSPSKQGGNPYCIGDTTEKEQMEAVAAVTHRILAEEYQCVVYTATPELELRERAFEAMELHADIYLAIHSNATGNGSVQYGASSYYCAASARSKKLGENINRELNAIAPKKCTLNKQMYSAMDSFGGVGYAEIRDPYNLGLVPVLAETDFHDNELTARWIMDNHEAIGRAYADALVKAFDIPKK